MAIVSDTLRTVLEVQGLSAYLSNLRQVQQGSVQAGLAHDKLQQGLTGLPRLLNQVTTSLGGTLGSWSLVAVGAQAVAGAVGQVAQAMGQAMGTFDRYNDALTRATVLFGNAGRGNQSGALGGLARGRLFGLGISEDRTLNLAGRMAELGYSPGTIDKLLPAIQDINAGSAGRISEDRALTMLTRAVRSGGGRGAQALGSRLGLDVRLLTGNANRDIRYLADQIHDKFGGVAAALAGTATGVHQQNEQLLTAAMGRLGGLVEYGLLPIFETTNSLLKGFITGADKVLHPAQNSPLGNLLIDTSLRTLERLPFSGLLGLLARGVRESRARDQAAGQRAGSLEQRLLKAAEETAQNTRQVASAVAVAVFGNASSFSRQSLSWSSLNNALNLRV